jgi:hypothetical protein
MSVGAAAPSIARPPRATAVAKMKCISYSIKGNNLKKRRAEKAESGLLEPVEP